MAVAPNMTVPFDGFQSPQHPFTTFTLADHAVTTSVPADILWHVSCEIPINGSRPPETASLPWLE